MTLLAAASLLITIWLVVVGSRALHEITRLEEQAGR